MAYVGNKWSERAQEAYDAGSKPISKWTKDEILSAYSPEAAEKLEKLPLKKLRENLLKWKGWHHTGKFYSETDFYEPFPEDELDIDDIIGEINRESEAAKKERKAAKEFARMSEEGKKEAIEKEREMLIGRALEKHRSREVTPTSSYYSGPAKEWLKHLEGMEILKWMPSRFGGDSSTPEYLRGYFDGEYPYYSNGIDHGKNHIYELGRKKPDARPDAEWYKAGDKRIDIGTGSLEEFADGRWNTIYEEGGNDGK